MALFLALLGISGTLLAAGTPPRRNSTVMRGPTAESAKAQLLEIEAAWLAASQRRDIIVLRRILSDDYVDISYRGAVRHKADALRGPAVDPRKYVQQIGDQVVRLFGNTAIVTGRGLLSDHAGKRVAAWRFTDVFRRRGDTWQAVSSQETPER